MRNNAAYLPESPIVYIILPKSIRNRASLLIFVLRNEYLRRCHTPASAGESIYVSDSGRLGAAGGPWQSCDCAFRKETLLHGDCGRCARSSAANGL